MGILLTILLVALLIYVFKGIIIVQQQQEVIIERMGRYEIGRASCRERV